MWIFAVGLNWTLLYGFYPHQDDGILSPPWLNDLYITTFRTAWSLTCAWVAYACLTGWGGTFRESRFLGITLKEMLG